MTFKPIEQPSGKYRDPPVTVLEAPEPVLVITDVPWQPQALPPLRVPQQPGVVLDTPQLGGRLTILVLLRGKETKLHKKCLESITKTVPDTRRDLRVMALDVPKETIEYLVEISPDLCYIKSEDIGKYPAMRQMLWDDKNPITTSYVAWFDDTAFVNHGDWLNVLAKTISCQKPGIGMFGTRQYYTLEDPRDRLWFEQANWHFGRPLRLRTGVPAPNGNTIHFIADWFWVAKTEAIKVCNIPDERLLNQGGDITVGEQLYQGGYKIMEINHAKALVYSAAGKFRGEHAKKGGVYPWAQSQ